MTGELLSRVAGTAVTQYEHDAYGRLRAVELPDGTLVEYDLDARGRRVGRSVDGVLQRAWIYDGQLDPVAELDGEGDVVSRFVYGSMPHVPDVIERAGVTYRVLTDHLGSVRMVVNAANGSVAQRMDYGPWGEVVLDTNPGFQPFGYAGGMWDAATGLVQFGAREYDAGLGRWVSRDPVLFGGGVNLFAYAANDPVNLVDPNGENPLAGAAAACALNPACAAAAANAAAHLAGLALAQAAWICWETGWCKMSLPAEREPEPEATPEHEPYVCGPRKLPDGLSPAPLPRPMPGDPGDEEPPPMDRDCEGNFIACSMSFGRWSGDCATCKEFCDRHDIWPWGECSPPGGRPR